MQNPPIPIFEKERQASLASYQIMDSEREKAYDEIAELASYICGTPVSLITFIDSDRQWFKAAVGTEFTGNTRKDSFCTFVLPEPDELLIVPNTQQDVRFCDNPLVVNAPNVSFYAGVALKSREGLPIGTLCVLDVKPNQLNDQQQKALRTLADQTSKLLELRRRNIEIIETARMSQSQLQAQIDDKVVELKVKNNHLERANEEIKRIVYIASHDLKEPVRKLKIYTDLLRHTQQDPIKMGAFVEKINAFAEHINDLIQDIGIYSEINLNNADKQPVNLYKLAEKVLDEYHLQISESEASVKILELPIIQGDEGQFYQMLVNFLTNSLKYSVNRPKIEWSCETVQEKEMRADTGNLPRGPYYRLDFKDNGIGIEKEYSGKIFEFLSRLHTSKEFEGNGIGLAIVKKVAQNHKGWVSVTSEPNAGTVFSVYLPKI